LRNTCNYQKKITICDSFLLKYIFKNDDIFKNILKCSHITFSRKSIEICISANKHNYIKLLLPKYIIDLDFIIYTIKTLKEPEKIFDMLDELNIDISHIYNYNIIPTYFDAIELFKLYFGDDDDDEIILLSRVLLNMNLMRRYIKNSCTCKDFNISELIKYYIKKFKFLEYSIEIENKNRLNKIQIKYDIDDMRNILSMWYNKYTSEEEEKLILYNMISLKKLPLQINSIIYYYYYK